MSAQRLLQQRDNATPSVSSEDSFAYSDQSQWNNSNPSGACSPCKSYKVKCHFPPGQTRCQRCQLRGYACVLHLRKRRKAAPTQEELLARSDRQDAQIQLILSQFENLRKEQKWQAWYTDSAGAHTGIPAYSYPSLGQPFPDLVSSGTLKSHEINELFHIYFTSLNPTFPLLDPILHEPNQLMFKSPFLFTVVCTIACRFGSYRNTNSNLYALVVNFARDAAAQELISGRPLRIETCQAYLLLTLYPLPVLRLGDDRSSLMVTLALRTALEIGLNRNSLPIGCEKREATNRRRTWSCCVFVDAVYNKKEIVTHSRLGQLRYGSYDERNFALLSDVHFYGTMEICGLMEDFWTYLGGRGVHELERQGFNLNASIAFYDQKLSELISIWMYRYEQEPGIKDVSSTYRSYSTRLTAIFMQLLILNSGISEGSDVPPVDWLLPKLVQTGHVAITLVVDYMYPTGLLKYSIEAHFLCAAFAAIVLLNLLGPRYNLYGHDKITILTRVRQLIDVLNSKDVSMDDDHAPTIYSRHLASLLQNTQFNEATLTPVS